MPSEQVCDRMGKASNVAIHGSFEALKNSMDKDDVEKCMRTMDTLFQAEFLSYVRDPTNALSVARHLRAFAKEYDIGQVARGLRWLITAWSVRTSAETIKTVSRFWPPEKIGLLCKLVAGTWKMHPDLTTFLGTIIEFEDVYAAARILRSFTIEWDIKSIAQLISYLDYDFKWKQEYFKQLTSEYIGLIEIESSRTHQLQISRLSQCYRTNLASATYRLCAIELKILLATQNLQTAAYNIQIARNRALLGLGLQLPNATSSSFDIETSAQEATQIDYSKIRRQDTLPPLVELPESVESLYPG